MFHRSKPLFSNLTPTGLCLLFQRLIRHESADNPAV